jgi:hypothetical protein
LAKTFTNTDNKDFIRSVDYGFLKQEVEHQGKKLRYFGLPGEKLYDVIVWKEFLNEFVAVERGSKSDPCSKQNLLVCKALQLGFFSKLTLLRGEINEIIISDKDEIGKRVPYPFELINLDYGGSILYPDRLRTDALEILVSRQRPIDFLLFITSNIREFDQNELLNTQRRIRQEILQYRVDIKGKIDSYFELINKREPIFRQILHLHFLVKYLGEINKYKTTCFPAIYYQGSKKTELIHYIFRFRYQKGDSTRVISDQSLLDILNQGFKKLVDGSLNDIQPPFKIG